MTHAERELAALEICDGILEDVQAYTRGATQVKGIRELIGKRIEDLNKEAEPIPIGSKIDTLKLSEYPVYEDVEFWIYSYDFDSSSMASYSSNSQFLDAECSRLVIGCTGKELSQLTDSEKFSICYSVGCGVRILEHPGCSGMQASTVRGAVLFQIDGGFQVVIDDRLHR